MSKDGDGHELEYVRYGRRFWAWVGPEKLPGPGYRWHYIVLGPQLFDGTPRRTVGWGYFARGSLVIEGGIMTEGLKNFLLNRYNRLRKGKKR